MQPKLTVIAMSLALCACTDVELGSSEQGIGMPLGGVATNGVATNGVATNGVATNALASEALATGALAIDSNVKNQHVSLGLEDPNAQIFMKYLVGCALRPDQEIRWSNHDSSINVTWRGALGLCPEWQASAPDAACRQRVSACILARNNAFGVSVMFSMRGMNPDGPIGLASSVPAHDHYPQTAELVRSLAGCRRGVPADATRDCGWKVRSIGRCEPGRPVSIAQGNRANCTDGFLGTVSDANTMLRVCDGISACDHKFAIASVDDACNSTAPGIDFSCPTSGLYAVMLGNDNGKNTGEIAATTAYDGAYPAAEGSVFQWREGAFYGDIFGRANIAPGKTQVTVNPTTYQVEHVAESEAFVGVVFPNMFACSSDNWAESTAYMQRRVCAGPAPGASGSYTRNCAANYVGPCIGAAGGTSRCGSQDSAPYGDGDYADCQGTNGNVYRFPMTPVLASACDMIPGFCAATPGAPHSW